MKFIVDSADFQSAIDKALVICPVKAPFASLNCVYISADEDVTIIATSLSRIVAIHIEDADIVERGKVLVSRDEIEKIYKLDGLVTVTANNGVITTKNTKKERTVKLYDYEYDDFAIFEQDAVNLDLPIVRCEVSEFMAILAAEKDFRSDNPARPIYTGFNLNAKKQRIEAVDGYKAAYRHMNGEYFNDQNVVICGEVYEDLKKIVKTKAEKNGLFTISYGKSGTKPLVQISADNFDYFCRALEGDFLDMDKTVNMSEHFVRVVFDREEVHAVMKEHYKYDDRERPKGSYIIIGRDGKCATAMRGATYQSMDMFEPIGKVQGVDDEFVAHLQSNYMMQVCEFYKGEDGITMWAKGLTSPVYFTAGDDTDSVAMLLPLRTESEVRTSVINDYHNFFAA